MDPDRDNRSRAAQSGDQSFGASSKPENSKPGATVQPTNVQSPCETAACQAPATLEVTIAMADHMDWIGDRGSCGLACFACQNGQTPEATVHQITRRVNGAWFRRHLGGDVAMDPWLAADRVGSSTTLRTARPGC